MKNDKDISQVKASRRRFLISAGAGAAAAGAALAATQNPQVQNLASDQTEQAKGSKGYQLSEHVKTYYRTLLV